MRKILKPNLHQKLTYKFPRRTIQVQAVNDTWCIDLMDFNSSDLSNSGYILNCIDIMSRYAQSVRLHSKSKGEIQQALSKLFELFNAKPKKIWSDKESSIVSLKGWLADKGIELYHVDNSYNGPNTHSVSIVEKFNQFMWDKMTEYKRDKPGTNWNQRITYTIKNFIPFYNNKVHSTTGTTPLEAYNGDFDVKTGQDKRAMEKKDEPNETLEVGKIVWLQKPKQKIWATNDNKYYPTPETIVEVRNTNPTTYRLKGWGDTSFYYEQFAKEKKKKES